MMIAFLGRFKRLAAHVAPVLETLEDRSLALLQEQRGSLGDDGVVLLDRDFHEVPHHLAVARLGNDLLDSLRQVEWGEFHFSFFLAARNFSQRQNFAVFESQCRQSPSPFRWWICGWPQRHFFMLISLSYCSDVISILIKS